MAKQLVSVSDWIQHLISIRTMSFTLLGILFTSVIAITSILFNFSNNLTYVSYIELNVINYSFIAIALWLTFVKKSPLHRATKLFNRIMQNPGEIEVDEIRREWYRENDNMWNRIKQSEINGYKLIGIISCIVGGILWIITAILVYSVSLTADNISKISILISLSLGLISIGIAFYSIGLSKDSDKKMISIANANFLNIVNMVEDIRINFIIGAYHPETFTWKTLSCLEMAKELLAKDVQKKFIKNEYQNKLVHYFNNSLEVFFDEGYSWTKLKKMKRGKNSQEHIIHAYRIIQDFYKEPNIKTELENILITKMNKNERNDFNNRL